MNTTPRSGFRLRHGFMAVTCFTVAWLGACSSSSSPNDGTGGAANTGGATSTGGAGTGGATGGSTGGTTNTGGAANTGGATGGSTTGGAQGGAKGGSSGGATSTGGAAAGGAKGGAPGGGGSSGSMTLTSTAFAEGQMIPVVHTCAAGTSGDTSPPLAWEGAPASTKSFVVVLHDPDASASGYTHWAIWDIPASVTSLPAKIDETSAMPSNVAGARQTPASGYMGPCPSGNTHNYRFMVYAIPTEKLTVSGANPMSAQIMTAAQQQSMGNMGTLRGSSNARRP